jgi:crotonobetainyl-CoA:carnitine CoA-transferase CaiB-like acyl-CoA transferase
LFYVDRIDGRRIPQVGCGIGVDGTHATYRVPPPRLGEHTGEVLQSWLDYDEHTVEQLRRTKVI